MGSMKCILKCERISKIDVVVYQSMFAVNKQNWCSRLSIDVCGDEEKWENEDKREIRKC